jgi:hypothetical protein
MVEPRKPRKPRKTAQPAARPRKARKKPGATEELVRTDPEKAPLPDPAGSADTSSPVDLAEPVPPLPHPLRWTTLVILTASLVLAIFNAGAIRGWSYQLTPGPVSARIVAAAEGWYDLTAAAGLDRPAATLRGWWLKVKELRFGDESAEPGAAAD